MFIFKSGKFPEHMKNVEPYVRKIRDKYGVNLYNRRSFSSISYIKITILISQIFCS